MPLYRVSKYYAPRRRVLNAPVEVAPVQSDVADDTSKEKIAELEMKLGNCLEQENYKDQVLGLKDRISSLEIQLSQKEERSDSKNFIIYRKKKEASKTCSKEKNLLFKINNKKYLGFFEKVPSWDREYFGSG